MQETVIEGINIISKEPIYELPAWMFIACGCSLLVFIVTKAIANGATAVAQAYIFHGLSLMAITIFIMSLVMMIFWKGTETGRYIYQATIDENVKLSEFYERYEVIEKDGEIWTIQDKEEK